MKKFFAILCVLLMLPVMCFATSPSPTGKKMVSCSPELEFVYAEETKLWVETVKRIEGISAENEGYI